MTYQSKPALAAEATPIVEFWNETLAPKFVAFRHILEGGLSRHSEKVMPMLDFRPGDRVLDVGCGFGDTAIAIGQKVGPEGSVLGVDCCDAFLQIARSRPEKGSARNVRFAVADVEQGLSGATYDAAFARFGTMFFANPVTGLRAIRNALVPGGRFTHIVWRQREDNPWLVAARDVVQSFLPAPDPALQSCGPGPFSMADQDVTRAQMAAAGFTDITFQRVDAKVSVGRDVADAIRFQLAIGPAGETFREAGALAEARRPEIEAALAELFREVSAREGGLWMDSSSWLITARAPD
ncbi:methyltransferase domain-containing protein [Frigidibacter sp. RF13]|uniref:class I SAM-dependent methyltransferase n=1 Tax=Frigidibacter sp. RF13 TaxID=2997340 RepID=UPI0022709F6F|nr:methyltransferase domain-containing protein [Frigidibacter sp. RF13]MCY1128490.1 methyltransferase domain-containing protein [Frigidibacter sp. RF13]